VESLAPGIRTAALQPVREPLGDLDLQGIVFRIPGRRSGGIDRPILRERVQRALQTVACWECGIWREVGEATCSQSGLDCGATEGLGEQIAVLIIVVRRTCTDSAAGGARPGSGIGKEPVVRVRLRRRLAQETQRARQPSRAV